MLSRIAGLLGRGAPTTPGFLSSVAQQRDYGVLAAIAAKAAGMVTPPSSMQRIDISSDMPAVVKEVMAITSGGDYPTDLDLVPKGRGVGRNLGRPGTFELAGRNQLFELLFNAEVLKGRTMSAYYQNSGRSLEVNGHFHMYSSHVDLDKPNLKDDGLRAVQRTEYYNMLRKAVGSMGIGAQELTPGQAAMKAAISRPFHRVENGYDIGRDLDPVASKQYAMSQWENAASVDGANFFLGKGSMVEASVPAAWASAYTTSDGFQAYALPLQTSGWAHPLEGTALHIVGVHPNGFLASYVIGAGKHPWLLVDQMNQPVAGSMWSVRHDVLLTSLNEDKSLKEAMGKGGFGSSEVFMADFWDWFKQTDPETYRRCMKLSAFDQLSPYMAGYTKSEKSLLSYIADKTVTEADLAEWDSSMEERGAPPELFDGPDDEARANEAFDVPEEKM